MSLGPLFTVAGNLAGKANVRRRRSSTADDVFAIIVALTVFGSIGGFILYIVLAAAMHPTTH